MSVEVANETEWQLDPKVFSELGLWVMHQMRVSTQSELTITFDELRNRSQSCMNVGWARGQPT